MTNYRIEIPYHDSYAFRKSLKKFFRETRWIGVESARRTRYESKRDEAKRKAREEENEDRYVAKCEYNYQARIERNR